MSATPEHGGLSGFRRGADDGFHVGYGQWVTHADWTTFTSALEFGDDHNEPAATPAEMLPYVSEAFSKAHEHRECERIAEEEACRLGECDHDEHPATARAAAPDALRAAGEALLRTVDRATSDSATARVNARALDRLRALLDGPAAAGRDGA